eukprot:969563-Pleurochrysis_carterae.AAC.1
MDLDASMTKRSFASGCQFRLGTYFQQFVLHADIALAKRASNDARQRMADTLACRQRATRRGCGLASTAST